MLCRLRVTGARSIMRARFTILGLVGTQDITRLSLTNGLISGCPATKRNNGKTMARRRNLLLRFLIALGVVFASAHAIGQADGSLTRFPGTTGDLASPGGMYLLHNLDSDSEPHHSLYVKRRGSSRSERLMSYPRYVEVLWSPNGRRLLVNDHRGSDITTPIVFSFGSKTSRTDLFRLWVNRYGSEQHIFENGHITLQGTEWTDNDTILISLSAYGSSELSGKYEYTFGKGVRKLS